MGVDKVITPAVVSFASMNYFFLKTVAGKINHEIINEELDGYIKAIDTKYYTIDRDMRSEVLKELRDGAHFDGMSLENIKTALHKTIENITGESYPNVADFYVIMYETAQEA